VAQAKHRLQQLAVTATARLGDGTQPKGGGMWSAAWSALMAAVVLWFVVSCVEQVAQQQQAAQEAPRKVNDAKTT
jgi:hypothetical protein